MEDNMQKEAYAVAETALELFSNEKDVAAYIRREFEQRYLPTWQCVVGRNFGCFVTHETKRFTYFYIGQIGFLLWKSG